MGFSFDFTVQQWGGRLRPDTTEVLSGTATTPVMFKTDINTTDKSDIPDVVETTQEVDWYTTSLQFVGYSTGQTSYEQYGGGTLYGSFNNGPANYQVEFTQGGTDTMTLKWNNKPTPKTFIVPYLNMKVTNTIGYNSRDLIIKPYRFRILMKYNICICRWIQYR